MRTQSYWASVFIDNYDVIQDNIHLISLVFLFMTLKVH